MVYIREAHAADSSWPFPVPGEGTINTPKTYQERVGIANRCCRKLHIKMPCLVDDMDNTVEQAYAARPDRIYLVDAQGKVAVRAKRGPFGFGPGVEKTKKWLEDHFPKIE